MFRFSPESKTYPVYRSGFSLLEILVSTVILAIIGVFIVQIADATSSASQLSNRAVDAASQARLVFDRLAIDLAARVNRTDLDFVVQDTSSPSVNSNLLLFLSDVLSPDADRKESLIAYRVGPHADNQGLSSVLRAGKPVPWANAFSFAAIRPNGLPLKFSDFDPNALPRDADFEVLAPGVLQMVIGFQLYPDNLPVELADGSSPNPDRARGQIVYSAPTKSVVSTNGNPTSTYIDMSRVSSLVVGLVAIDPANLKLLKAEDTQALAGAFPTPAQGKLPVESWTPVTTDLASSGPGPLPARQSARVYHRFFPINSYGTQQR